jgi:uncharacterized protein YoxC
MLLMALLLGNLIMDHYTMTNEHSDLFKKAIEILNDINIKNNKINKNKPR